MTTLQAYTPQRAEEVSTKLHHLNRVLLRCRVIYRHPITNRNLVNRHQDWECRSNYVHIKQLQVMIAICNGRLVSMVHLSSRAISIINVSCIFLQVFRQRMRGHYLWWQAQCWPTKVIQHIPTLLSHVTCILWLDPAWRELSKYVNGSGPIFITVKPVCNDHL